MNYIKSVPALSTVVSLEGYNFNYTQYVFLSSNQTVLLPAITAVNLFSALPGVSSNNPPFSGYRINSYDIINKNIMNITLKLSANALPSLYDIVVVNAAGYTKLSDNGYVLSGARG
jgi:hypothetical protein